MQPQPRKQVLRTRRLKSNVNIDIEFHVSSYGSQKKTNKHDKRVDRILENINSKENLKESLPFKFFVSSSQGSPPPTLR